MVTSPAAEHGVQLDGAWQFQGNLESCPAGGEHSAVQKIEPPDLCSPKPIQPNRKHRNHINHVVGHTRRWRDRGDLGLEAAGDEEEWYVVTADDDCPRTDADTIILTGKQWHEPRKAFRPASGLTSYEKRAKDRVAQTLVKAKEKELKDEKESERQVRWFHSSRGGHQGRRLISFPNAETHYRAKREACRQGGEGAVREDGREDAQEEGREVEAQGEAQQADQLVMGRHIEFSLGGLVCIFELSLGIHT
jgi:hypothetical protein